MTLKLALIVDDSKSARVVLSRLLEKNDLAVETRDSAEAAFEYLEQHRPDVIFMDHTMAGMDGLSAVQLIKKDPNIASIPILMYTSQDGAVYADAAKASGADAILPKQMSPSDITDALVRLKVISSKAAQAAEKVPAANDPAPLVVAPGLSASDVRAIVEPLVRDQAGELRQFMVSHGDAAQNQWRTELHAAVDEAVAELIARLTPPPPEPQPKRPYKGLLAALIAVFAATVILALFYARAQTDILSLRATIDRQSSALVAASSAAAPAATTLWPTERHALGYGEAPFNAARLAQVSNWLSQLESRGFVGTAQIVVSLADYCLTGNPGEGYALAPGDMRVTDCDLKGSPPDDARPAAEREPRALSAAITALSERTHGEIDAKVSFVKASGYPAVSALAGQWNDAATKGHYVELKALPRSP